MRKVSHELLSLLKQSTWVVLLLFIALLAGVGLVDAQQATQRNIPIRLTTQNDVELRIVQAEDNRRFNSELLALLKDQNPAVRRRAALAAGRIGDELAIEPLADLLRNDPDLDVRIMAAFGLGELESSVGAGAQSLITTLENEKEPSALRARSVEALGKITAALPKSDTAHSQQYGEVIITALKHETDHPSDDRTVALLGLTAALRARPANAAPVIAAFLSNPDPRIRADAENTLARLRAKEATGKLRELLVNDPDAVVRANAARALASAEDKGAVDALIARALNDSDVRVRVSAVRTLGTLKDARATPALIDRGNILLTDARKSWSHVGTPMQVNEFLEIASAIRQLEPKSGDTNSVSLFKRYEQLMGRVSPEVEIAFATVDPIGYLQNVIPPQDVKSATDPEPLLFSKDWHVSSSIAQALATYAAESPTEMSKATVQYAVARGLVVSTLCRGIPGCKSVPDLAYPDVLRAYAAFKPQTLARDLITALTDPDVIVRSTAAELIGELPPTDEIADALTAAFPRTMHDELNDAALAILDALGKQKPELANASVKSALDSQDLIIRRRAVAILKANKAGDFSSRIGTTNSRNNAGDYQRALSRIGRTITAVVRTSKGSFTIQLLPDEAPLNVDNFVQLAKRGYFNGIVFHRVVPNFVVQGGDPRGDGNGGPGYQIRCEINEETYDRGAVGMALSGKDTGGSQWFVTHSPQPHLDGGYTVFGKVTKGMDVVDRIVKGDTIFGVSVTEGAKRASKTRRAVS